jgi:hypothetical protein
MVARVRVRANILAEQWQKSTGQAVTRNVDIFAIDPSYLLTCSAGWPKAWRT